MSLALLMPAIGIAQKTSPATPDEVQARLTEAQKTPTLKDALVKKGKQAAAVCMYCHGDTGNSVKGEVPNLADQNQSYLLSQITQFIQGKRKNEFMEGIMKALSTDEKVGVVLYYSSQIVTPHPSPETHILIRGKELYKNFCVSCHAEDGHGNDQLARVAGQQKKYLETTLRRYQTSSGGRTDPAMSAITKNITNTDLDALITYIGSMP